MKLTLLTAISLFLNFSVYSQGEFPDLWKTGKEKEIYGHTILRKEGDGASSPYITYKSKQQLIEDAKINSQSQMWAKDSLQNLTNYYDSYLKGGIVSIKLVSNNIKGANPENLTVIIQDNNGNEILRNKLEPSVPTYQIIGGTTFWTGFAVLSIPIEITTPFTVYLINSQYTDIKYSKKAYQILN
jgi:hypothetical protein